MVISQCMVIYTKICGFMQMQIAAAVSRSTSGTAWDTFSNKLPCEAKLMGMQWLTLYVYFNSLFFSDHFINKNRSWEECIFGVEHNTGQWEWVYVFINKQLLVEVWGPSIGPICRYRGIWYQQSAVHINNQVALQLLFFSQ